MSSNCGASLTSSLLIGKAYDATVRWIARHDGDAGESVMPCVTECDDSWLSNVLADPIDDDDVWEYEHRNIFLSAIHVSREFLALPAATLRKIINVSSLYGNLHGGSAQFLQYSAFKAALASVSATLNKSTAPNVIVNAVAPGYTETPAWAGAPAEVKDALARTTAIGRFVTAEEVAHAVVFIAENDALVGQVLTLDGGTSLKVLP